MKSKKTKPQSFGRILLIFLLIGLLYLSGCSTSQAIVDVGQAVLDDVGSVIGVAVFNQDEPIDNWQVFLRPTLPIPLTRLYTEADPTAAVVIATPRRLEDKYKAKLAELSATEDEISDDVKTKISEQIRLYSEHDAHIERFNAALIRAALQHTDVFLLYNEDDIQAVRNVVNSAKSVNARKGSLYLVPSRIDSMWVRDYGTVFGEARDGRLVALDAMYRDVREEGSDLEKLLIGDSVRTGDDTAPTYIVQALRTRYGQETELVRVPLQLWGGDLSSDGKGTLFVSSESLTMNGALIDKFEGLLKSYYGAKSVVYLEALPGPTIKHQDMLVKVIDDRRVLLAHYQPAYSTGTAYGDFLDSEIRRILNKNYERIHTALPNAEIIRIPMPSPLAGLVESPDNFIAQQTFEAMQQAGWVDKASVLDPESYRNYQEAPSGSPEEFEAIKRLVLAGEKAWRRILPDSLVRDDELLDEFSTAATGKTLDELGDEANKGFTIHSSILEYYGEYILKLAEARDEKAVAWYFETESGSIEEMEAIERVVTVAAEEWASRTNIDVESNDLIGRFVARALGTTLDRLQRVSTSSAVRLLSLMGSAWIGIASRADPTSFEIYNSSDVGTKEELAAAESLILEAAKAWRDYGRKVGLHSDSTGAFVDFLGLSLIEIQEEAVASASREAISRDVIYRTYLNSLLINDEQETTAVLIPRYEPQGRETVGYIKGLEQQVESAYRQFFPNAKLHWIQSDAIVRMFGAVHCVTSVVPAASL